MPETTTTQLSESDVERLASRGPLTDFGSVANLTISERDALIRDWRALRAENELAEKVLKFILPNHPLATITELAKPVLDEVDRLRQAESERKIAVRYLSKQGFARCDQPEHGCDGWHERLTP